MKLLNPQQAEVLQRLDEIGLASSVMRDFSAILPWVFNEQWHTSITLRNKMRWDDSYTRKELNRISSALCNVYNNSELLKRREKRKIYHRYQHSHHISHWAYQLNWDYLAQIMPNPEVEEYNRLKAQHNYEQSLE